MDNSPFQCTECKGVGRAEFAVFEPAQDYLVVFPEKNLIHIHLGGSITDDRVSLAQSHFYADWIRDTLSQYPEKHFFYVVDMSRKDSSESMPLKSMQMLRKIITNPQLPKGAAYGLSWGWHAFISLFLHTIGVHVFLEPNAESAQKRYQEWKEKYTGDSSES